MDNNSQLYRNTNPNAGRYFNRNPNANPNAFLNTNPLFNPNSNPIFSNPNKTPNFNPTNSAQSVNIPQPAANDNTDWKRRNTNPHGTRPPPRTFAMRTSIDEEQNPDLLLAPTVFLGECSNINARDLARPFRGQLQRLTLSEFLIYLFWTCKRSGLQRCSDKFCRVFKETLRNKYQPNCHSWPEFLEWATQMAACLCARNNGNMGLREDDSMWKQFKDMYSGLSHPFNMQTRYGEFSNRGIMETMGSDDIDPSAMLSLKLTRATGFQQTRRIIETLNVMSWLGGIVGGEHGFETVPVWKIVSHTSSTSKSPHRDPIITAAAKEVMNSSEKLSRSGLCPARVWAIVKSLPGVEHNLTPLLDVPFQFPEHKGHTHCTFDFCEFANINSTRVEQLHKCVLEDKSRCPLTNLSQFDRDKLNNVCRRSLPSAWSLDGLSILPRGEKYMAISHVWSDGTGVGGLPSGQVHKCLYRFWSKLAAAQGCQGFWWDAVCVPNEKVARARAINEMHLNYENADVTLVHDLYLCKTEWDDNNPGKGAFALIMSPWFTRAWTALELARSKRVRVLFKAPSTGSLIIKDLDTDILAQPGKPSSRYHQIATAAIQRLRAPIESINDLLIAFQSRVTSWARDRGIIAALLVNVAKPYDLDKAQEFYTSIVRKVGKIDADNLLHGLPTMGGNFAWLPTSMLDMPITHGGRKDRQCDVNPNGSITGRWRVRPLDVPGNTNTSAGRETEYYRPLTTHPYLLTRIIHAQSSVEERKKHILLVGAWGRALLARVIKRKQGSIGDEKMMYAEYVGCVMADETSLEREIDICMCDGGDKTQWDQVTDSRMWMEEIAAQQRPRSTR